MRCDPRIRQLECNKIFAGPLKDTLFCKKDASVMFCMHNKKRIKLLQCFKKLLKLVDDVMSPACGEAIQKCNKFKLHRYK